MKSYETPIMEVIRINMDIITGSCDTQMPELCADEA